MGTEPLVAAARTVALDRQAIGRGGELGQVALAAILHLRRDAERAEVHHVDATGSPQDFASPLEVLARSLAQDFGFDEVGDRGHDYRFPRFACSRSIASKSALKLPTPKPREPWRSMISKKNVGRSWTGRVKICRR
jgi:hypothetical protein